MISPKYLALIIVCFLVSCGSAALPETVEVEPQVLPTSVEQPTSSPAAETAISVESTQVHIASPQPPEETEAVAESSQAEPEVPPGATVFTPGREERGISNERDDFRDDVAIVFQRRGGFAGLDERWIIYRDGRIESPRGEWRPVPAAQVQTLLETMQTLGFFEMKESYVPRDTCCDRFHYTITAHFNGATKMVETVDSSPTQPGELAVIIHTLGELLFKSE